MTRPPQVEDDMPDWWRRLDIVRKRHPEMSQRELAKRGGLSHTTVENILSGNNLNPKRETLAQLVFTLTERPNEREAVLGDFDTLVEAQQRALFDGLNPPVPAPPSEMQALTVVITDFTRAVSDLTRAIIALAEVLNDRER